MSEIVIKNCTENWQSVNDEDEYVSFCCSDRSDLLVTVKKEQVKHFSRYFSDILHRFPTSSNKEVLIFLKDVPYNDLKMIGDYINGEDVRVATSDLSSLERSCEIFQIDELLSLIKDERIKLMSEIKPNELMSEDSSPEQRVVSELIPNVNDGTEKCVFEKLWFKEGSEELNDESDELEFSLETVNSDGKILEHNSTASSSVYFDCNESNEQQKGERKRKDSEVDVEDAVIEVSSSSSNSVDSFVEYASVTTVKVATNETENPLDNSFSSVFTHGSHSSRNESSNEMLESPNQEFQMPTYIYLPPFSSGDPSGFSYQISNNPSAAIPPPPPLTPFYNVIRSGRDIRQKPRMIAENSAGSSSAAMDDKASKFKTRKRSNPRFKCGICGREMGWRQSVRVHILQQHPGNDPKPFIVELKSKVP